MSPSTDVRENREFALEIKFLVTLEMAAQIREWARFRLLPDPNGGGKDRDAYQITSLYFDTSNFDVYRRQGSFGRSKYRIRRYGNGEVTFLERKLRTGSLLAKRRCIVPIPELETLAAPEPRRDWAGFWFHRRLIARELKPVCRITYNRIARAQMTPMGPIRLTLDENLRARPVTGFELEYHPGPVILDGKVVLELKFRREMPALFKYLVEEFTLAPQRFSKYRQAIDSLGLAPENQSPQTQVQQHA